jgi:hypothetical protein
MRPSAEQGRGIPGDTLYAVTAPKTDYVGVGLKLDCPNGNYVSFITGMGSRNLAYQVVFNAPDTHPPLPWPPDPDSTLYGERCPCEVCVGRLVGDTVAAIRAGANGIQGTMRVNEDTYNLRHLESARDVIVREAQLRGYGIVREQQIGQYRIHHDAAFTETYVISTRRVIVGYDDLFQEVEHVTVWLPASTQQPETYPGTLAGALAALRGST